MASTERALREAHTTFPALVSWSAAEKEKRGAVRGGGPGTARRSVRAAAFRPLLTALCERRLATHTAGAGQGELQVPREGPLPCASAAVRPPETC